MCNFVFVNFVSLGFRLKPPQQPVFVSKQLNFCFLSFYFILAIIILYFYTNISKHVNSEILTILYVKYFFYKYTVTLIILVCGGEGVLRIFAGLLTKARIKRRFPLGLKHFFFFKISGWIFWSIQIYIKYTKKKKQLTNDKLFVPYGLFIEHLKSWCFFIFIVRNLKKKNKRLETGTFE